MLTTGSADRPGSQQFEAKTTYRSVSTLRSYPAPEGWVELKIVRLRELFTLFHRPRQDSEWVLLDQWVRPDLPATVQAGLIAYTDWDSAAPLYPDFARINSQGIPDGIPDLMMTVDSLALAPHRLNRFGAQLIDFASLGAEKIRQQAAL
ncbi:MAG: hypothetical protein JNL98_33385 [Bryobacterales bacterium]|nr:hypothetical protein [Bryobacterales bacterium]